jgi:short-subunit dehydrogenase
MNLFRSSVRSSYRALRKRAVEAALTGGRAVSRYPERGRLQRHAAALNERLVGQTVLVTGASSGIGRATALRAAKSGAKLVLVARSEPKLDELRAEIERHGGCATTYPVDLSSAAATQQLLEQLAAGGIEVDVLVNNAGRSIRRSIDEARERAHDYERTMALNYFGSVRLILGLVPGMRARRRGHVINVSSAGVQVGTPLFSAYVASKAALDAFTRVAAGETRADGVRFTTVHMPLVRTPMIAPTAAYRELAALTPEQAAEIVLRALITHEKQLGTYLGALFSLAHILLPDAAEHVLSLGHHLHLQA